MVAFFMPDGEGGSLAPDDAERTYATVRAAAGAESFWGGTFTDRRVYCLISRHNGGDYVQRVGELTRDKAFILGIFESKDEHGLTRFVVQSLRQTIHVDP